MNERIGQRDNSWMPLVKAVQDSYLTPDNVLAPANTKVKSGSQRPFSREFVSTLEQNSPQEQRAAIVQKFSQTYFRNISLIEAITRSAPAYKSTIDENYIELAKSVGLIK